VSVGPLDRMASELKQQQEEHRRKKKEWRGRIGFIVPIHQWRSRVTISGAAKIAQRGTEIEGTRSKRSSSHHTGILATKAYLRRLRPSFWFCAKSVNWRKKKPETSHHSTVTPAMKYLLRRQRRSLRHSTKSKGRRNARRKSMPPLINTPATKE
jgi:hypothetical protein